MKISSPHRDIAAWYDDLSTGWGKNYASGDSHFNRRMQNVHLLAEKLNEDAEILDIGCATGEITSSLHSRFKCKTTGIDISSKMIDHCHATYRDKNVFFKVGDILSLQFNDNNFDLVVSLSVIEWIDNYEKAISEVSRVLKHGGQWIVSIPNWCSPFRIIESITQKIRKQNYLQYQKNKLKVAEFECIAEKYGLKKNAAIYHVLPFYSKNVGGSVGSFLGMMCIMSLSKKQV